MTVARDREVHGVTRPLVTLPGRQGTATQGITERAAVTSPAEPAKVRLLLHRDDAGPAPLDGGWWPRSTDPAEELPSLVLALDKLHGRVTRVIPADTGERDAVAAMQQAARTGNREHALAILAAITAAASPAADATSQRTP